MLHLKKLIVAVFVVLLSLTSCEKETIKEITPASQEITIGKTTLAKDKTDDYIQMKVEIVFDVVYEGTGEGVDNAVLMLTKEQDVIQGITDANGLAKIDMEHGNYILKVIDSGIPVNIAQVEKITDEKISVIIK